MAAALGDADADALMADVAAAGPHDRLDERRGLAPRSRRRWPGPRLGARPARDRPLGAGLVLRDGEVHLAADADPAADPTLVLRGRGRGGRAAARASTARRSTAWPPRPPTLPDPWPAEARDALRRAAARPGHAAIPVIEALDQLRPVGARSCPSGSRCAAGRSATPTTASPSTGTCARPRPTRPALADRVDAARPARGRRAAARHRQGLPGRPHRGRHRARARRSAPRMGFAAGRRRRARRAWSATTCCCPTSPPAATSTTRPPIDAVADAVGDRATLELLAALTEADSLATGPAAWGAWKAELVAELVDRTVDVLAGRRARRRPSGTDVPDRRAPRPAGRGRAGRPRATATALTVVAPDRPGLFSRVAGVLASTASTCSTADAVVRRRRHGARACSGCEPASAPTDRRGTGSTADLRAGARRAGSRSRPASPSGPGTYAPAPTRRRPATPPAVLVDNDASPRRTVVEVHAPDAIGVLYRITRALAELDLDIRSAKVQTLGRPGRRRLLRARRRRRASSPTRPPRRDRAGRSSTPLARREPSTRAARSTADRRCGRADADRATCCAGARRWRASPAPGSASPRASTSGSASRRCWPSPPTSGRRRRPTSELDARADARRRVDDSRSARACPATSRPKVGRRRGRRQRRGRDPARAAGRLGHLAVPDRLGRRRLLARPRWR